MLLTRLLLLSCAFIAPLCLGCSGSNEAKPVASQSDIEKLLSEHPELNEED